MSLESAMDEMVREAKKAEIDKTGMEVASAWAQYQRALEATAVAEMQVKVAQSTREAVRGQVQANWTRYQKALAKAIEACG